MKFPLTLLLLLVSHLAICQSEYLPGFLIPIDGDTLKGEILNQNNSAFAKGGKFKRDGNVESFTPETATGFGFFDPNRLFKAETVSIDGQEKHVFIEYLVDGIADLFYLSFNSGEYYFLEKDGELFRLENQTRQVKDEEQVYSVKKELYKGVLIYAFENKIPTQVIHSASLEPKSLIKLTEKYHNSVCDWECQIFRRNTTSSVSIILATKPELTKAYMAVDGTGTLHDSSVGFSGLLKFTSAKTSFFSFISGATVNRNSFTGSFSNNLKSGIYKRKDSVSIKQNILAIPLLVRYEFFKKGNLQISLTTGLENQFILSGTYSFHEKYNGEVPAEFRKYQIGFIGSPTFTVWLPGDKIGFNLMPFYRWSMVVVKLGYYFDSLAYHSVGTLAGIEVKLN